MRKVVIVDDESLVRVGLQSLFDWESYGYRIIGVYRDGREALSAIQETHPDLDVLLTDIKMPVMDGLELIEEAKKLKPELNVVILSSYSDFQYMRKAIQYGVKDYVLKYKIEQNELLKVLNSLKYAENTANEEIMDPLLLEKEGLIKALTVEQDSIEDSSGHGINLHFLQSILDLHYRHGSWVILKCAKCKPDMPVSKNKAVVLLVEETFKRLHNVEFIGADDLYLNAIVFSDKEMDTEEREKAITGIINEALTSVKDKLGINLIAAVSHKGEMNSLPDFTELRKNAIKTLQRSFYENRPVFIDKPEKRLRTISETERGEYLRKIKDFIRSEDLDGLFHWLVALSREPAYWFEPQEVIHMYRYCIHQMIDCLAEKNKDEYPSLRQSLGKLWSLGDLIEKADNYQYLTDTMDNMFREIKHLIDNTHTTHWIQTVRQYIMENYSKDVYLGEVAQMVNFSENYFSQRFKQETKCSFAEFLTNTRIQKAIELLKKTELSTEEISFRVGYNNPNYFVKVFKKVSGKTVSDFKKDLKK